MFRARPWNRRSMRPLRRRSAWISKASRQTPLSFPWRRSFELRASVTAPRPFATLRRFLPAKGAERCYLCGIALATAHPHLLEVGTRQMVCACDPCAILFEHRGVAKYRRVGRRVRYEADFRMTDAQWDSLLIPIGLAFFVNCTPEQR